jgi:hypothetical protein
MHDRGKQMRSCLIGQRLDLESTASCDKRIGRAEVYANSEPMLRPRRLTAWFLYL